MTRDWAEQAETWRRKALDVAAKGNLRMKPLLNSWTGWGQCAANSTMKSKSYRYTSARRKEIEFDDVTAICSRNKMARAFALGDALGERDLPRLLKRLARGLWWK